MRTASRHDPSQLLASSRHRVGANPSRTSSSISQVAKGGSAATASAWQTTQVTSVPSQAFCVGSFQRASTGDASSRHRKGVEDQGIDSRTPSGRHRGDVNSASCFGEGPTPSGSAAPGPPNQIHRRFHWAGQEAVASTRRFHQEALQKAESKNFSNASKCRSQRSLKFAVPSGIGTIGGAVAVGARWFGKPIEEPKFHEIGGDGPPYAEFRGSRATRVGTIRQTASSWRKHSETSRISHAGWSRSNWSCEMLSRWARLASSRSCPSCSPRVRSGWSVSLPWFPTWSVETGSSASPNIVGLAWRAGRRGFEPLGLSKHEVPAD